MFKFVPVNCQLMVIGFDFYQLGITYSKESFGFFF